MAETNSLDDRAPLFVGSAEQLKALETWLDEFTLAVTSVCDDNYGQKSYLLDLDALNKALSTGGDYLGCLNAMGAEECSRLIRELQKEVSAVLAGDLVGQDELSDEQARAYEKCQSILKHAVPHFQRLGVRIRDEIGKANLAEGNDSKQAAIGTNRITSKVLHDLEMAHNTLKERLSEVKEESKQGHPLSRPEEVGLAVHVFLRALQAVPGAGDELIRRAEFVGKSAGADTRFRQALDGVLEALNRLPPFPSPSPAQVAVDRLQAWRERHPESQSEVERVLSRAKTLLAQDLSSKVREPLEECRKLAREIVVEGKLHCVSGCEVLANWESQEHVINTSFAGTVMEFVGKAADSLMGWVRGQREMEISRRIAERSEPAEKNEQAGGGEAASLDVPLRGAGADSEDEEPTRHILDIIVDKTHRTIHREEFDKEVDLFSSSVGWHIFMTVLSAAPHRAEFDDVFGDAYPGERSARGPAVSNLNKQLKKLGLRVNNRTLGPIPSQ